MYPQLLHDNNDYLHKLENDIQAFNTHNKKPYCPVDLILQWLNVLSLWLTDSEKMLIEVSTSLARHTRVLFKCARFPQRYQRDGVIHGIGEDTFY